MCDGLGWLGKSSPAAAAGKTQRSRAHHAVKDAVNTRCLSAGAVISAMQLEGVTKRPVGASSVRQPADELV